MDDDFDLKKPGTLVAILVVVLFFWAVLGFPGCETSDPCERCSDLSGEAGFDCFMECQEGLSPPYPQEAYP